MRNVKNCNIVTNKTILNDVPHEDVLCFQYGILLVSNSSDITVEIKEINFSVTLAYNRMIT